MSEHTPPAQGPDDGHSNGYGNGYGPGHGPGHGHGLGYGYGPGYGYGYTPPPPQHPEASTAMTMGLVSVIGGLVCYLPIFLAPFALFKGRRVVREIDAEPGRWSGRDTANTGYVMGIVGTVLLAIGVVGLAILIAVLIGTESSGEY